MTDVNDGTQTPTPDAVSFPVEAGVWSAEDAMLVRRANDHEPSHLLEREAYLAALLASHRYGTDREQADSPDEYEYPDREAAIEAAVEDVVATVDGADTVREAIQQADEPESYRAAIRTMADSILTEADLAPLIHDGDPDCTHEDVRPDGGRAQEQSQQRDRRVAR